MSLQAQSGTHATGLFPISPSFFGISSLLVCAIQKMMNCCGVCRFAICVSWLACQSRGLFETAFESQSTALRPPTKYTRLLLCINQSVQHSSQAFRWQAPRNKYLKRVPKIHAHSTNTPKHYEHCHTDSTVFTTPVTCSCARSVRDCAQN
jgi:hypothetical protein